MNDMEGIPQKSQDEAIKINLDKDNIYVLGLKTLINKGHSLEEALRLAIKDFTKNPGFGNEHVKPVQEAAEQIRLELESIK